jgi:DNA-directed RNA polymerase subunit RPC12/RpoP
MTTWFEGSPDYHCPSCGWKGPAADIEGAAENLCPECGQKAKKEERDDQKAA